MTTLTIPSYIISLFGEEIKNIHTQLLSQIANDYNIDEKELLERYISDVDIISQDIEKLKISKIRKYNTNMCKEDQCIARVNKGTQCQRSKQFEQFCFIHQKAQPFGDIHSKIVQKKKKNVLY
jgi:hypothetical protein